MLPTKLIHSARSHSRTLTFVAGSAIVSLWTVLRFFNHRTIYDLVSQQVIVGHWLDGQMSTASIGQTHYLLKMVLLYVPLDLLPGDPRLKLILLTLIVNVCTFLLIAVLLEKIARHFGLKKPSYLYAALLWLACIAGSVFWIQFTNSRNLEVAGGLLLVYLGLRYIAKPTLRALLIITALSSVLFFADVLQLYMTALPLLIYSFVYAWKKGRQAYPVVQLSAAILGAYILSKFILLAFAKVFKLQFTPAPGGNLLSVLDRVPATITATIHSFAVLFGGGAEGGKIRLLINLLFAAAVFVLVAVAVFRRSEVRWPLLLVGVFFATDTLVYIASGQVLNGDTSRYLIMTAPLAVLAAAFTYHLHIPRRTTGIVMSGLLVMNVIPLSLALTRAWDVSFPLDAQARQISVYSRQHPGETVLGSIDTVLPSQYLYGDHSGSLLPVGCLDGRLVRTHYSNDAAFSQAARQKTGKIAVLFDGTSISNAPNICTVESVRHQFGLPLETVRTQEGDTMLFYNRQQVRL